MNAPAQTDCRRFDQRGIMCEERDEHDAAFDEHLTSCPDCQRRRARTAALRAALGQLPAPPSAAHWEQAVFARIAALAAEAPARRRHWLLALPLAAAAAIVLLVVMRRPGPQPETVSAAGPLLALDYEAGRQRLRSQGQPTVGTTVIVRDRGSVLTRPELRVYRDQVGMLFGCSDRPPCSRSNGRLVASFTITAIGHYRVVLLDAGRGAPPSTGSYDRDMAALVSAGTPLHTEEFDVW